MKDEELQSLLTKASANLFDLDASLGDAIYRPHRCSVYRVLGAWVVRLTMLGPSVKDVVDVKKTYSDEFLTGCVKDHGLDLSVHLLKQSMRTMFRAEIDRTFDQVA